MIPRPILLVKETGDAPTMHESIAGMLSREGYIVLRCAPEQFGCLKVLAPCPFTEADVEALRAMKRAAPEEEDEAVLESIADRISGMLAQEEAQ